MEKELLMTLFSVYNCDRYCKDNPDKANMCYCERTGGYRTCNPQENQCDFYIESLEKAALELREENSDLRKKLFDLNILVSAYHVCYEGALGAVEELLRTDCKDPRYYASVAKNYLSFRYEERERAKKVCEEYFEKLMEEEGAELKKQLYSIDSEAQELFTEKTNLEVELEELGAEYENLKKNDDKVYILQRLNCDDEVDASWVIKGFDKAVEVTRKLTFEWDTTVIRTCNFPEDYVEKELKRAHEYFDNLEIKIDEDGEWIGHLGRPYATWVLRELDLIQ